MVVKKTIEYITHTRMISSAWQIYVNNATTLASFNQFKNCIIRDTAAPNYRRNRIFIH